MAQAKVRERDLQAAIVKALELAGFEVKHTSAHRQRGPSGVSPGVPDLILAHPCSGGSLLGVEVKTPDGVLSPAQKDWADKGYMAVARSAEDAVAAALVWLKKSPGATKGAVAKAEDVLRSLAGPA